MRIVKGAFPFVVALATVALVTALLFYCKVVGIGPRHPIFFYLLPIALVALLYGSMPATLFAITAALCGTYFLYDPIYTFQFANRLEVGDVICFSVLALMAVKCAFELLRPAAKVPTARARYGRP